MQRLGKNLGRYQGETIDIEATLNQLHQIATTHGWLSETFHAVGDIPLRAYHLNPPSPRKQFYLSSGIHGDEPAGPLALLQLITENRWPPDIAISLCPCLNPGGFRLNTRENEAGIDLNRDYRSPITPAVRAHTAWLDQQPNFDLSVLLHEDWEANGYYIYEVNPKNLPSIAQPVIEAVRSICPIEHAPLVDNLWECKDGIIRPQINPFDRPQWAEAVYLTVNKASQGYTFEAPSDFPLDLRIRAHIRALDRTLALLQNPSPS